MKSPEELTDIFRARGLKVTPQRQCIFRVLHDAVSHPTAEAVYARASAEMPTISLRTVYQTLNDLTAMGEVGQLDLGTGSSRFDTNLDDHQHLVCDTCGAIRDVVVDFTDIRLPEHELGGFEVSSTDIVFRGRCDRCAAGDESAVSTTLLPEETSTHA
ncbi:MAG TPA: Fur family transcriptional regulator [Acidimicrobiales bacterium]|nr:Fur family transcriptional regulator [Acidimicrobiales bacterium]